MKRFTIEVPDEIIDVRFGQRGLEVLVPWPEGEACAWGYIATDQKCSGVHTHVWCFWSDYESGDFLEYHEPVTPALRVVK